MDRRFLKQAVDKAQRAQRNFDLEKQIPSEDLEILIYTAQNSPSKQNESHFTLHVYTDQEIIKNIYNSTKKFTLMDEEDDLSKLFGEKNGEYWQNDKDRSVTNSQVLANALFAYVIDLGEPRGGTHITGQNSSSVHAKQLYQEQISYSIGISIGELILSANLLGYKTGICSAMDGRIVKNILQTESSVKMLVGVGFDNPGVDRRMHAEIKNQDVPEKFRNGNLEEKWRFPSFDKKCKVFLNGKKYK